LAKCLIVELLSQPNSLALILIEHFPRKWKNEVTKSNNLHVREKLVTTKQHHRKTNAQGEKHACVYCRVSIWNGEGYYTKKSHYVQNYRKRVQDMNEEANGILTKKESFIRIEPVFQCAWVATSISRVSTLRSTNALKHSISTL